MSGDFEQAKSRVCQSEGAYVSVRPLASSWEQRKLGDCGSAYGGLSGKTKEDFGHGAAKFVPYTNVFDNPITDSNRLESIEKDSKQNEVRYGDALFTVSSETPEEVGMSSVWLSDQPNVYLNSFCFGYRQDGSFDSRYLAYMLRSQVVRSDLTLLAQGISRFNISKNKVMELEVPYPGLREQAQLGLFFERLDNLITLHQRKCQYRSLYGYLSWEQRKFADFVSASGIRNSENLELPSYSVTNDCGFVPQDKRFENGGTMREADKTSYWIVEPKSFAYNPARINVGSIGYQSTSGNVIVSSLYEVFQTDETCDDRFLWHWFKTRLFTQQIEMLQEGGVRLYFFFDKLLKSGISMPSVDEQRLIGEQFDWLDSLITLHQRKLELLRNIKKSLLDRMFV